MAAVFALVMVPLVVVIAVFGSMAVHDHSALAFVSVSGLGVWMLFAVLKLVRGLE